MFQQRSSIQVPRKLTQADRVVIKFKSGFSDSEVIVKDVDDQISAKALQKFLEQPSAIHLPENAYAFQLVGRDRLSNGRGIKRTVDTVKTPWFYPGAQPERLPDDPREPSDPNKFYFRTDRGPMVPIDKDAVVIPKSQVAFGGDPGVDFDALEDLMTADAKSSAQEIER